MLPKIKKDIKKIIEFYNNNRVKISNKESSSDLPKDIPLDYNELLKKCFDIKSS
jgi:hypothetical protein